MEQSIIKVNTQTLGDDSTSVDGYLKDLSLQLANLQSSITELNKMWTGEAYNAFQSAVNSDLVALQTVIENMRAVYQFEQTAKTEYESCEGKVAKLISEISIKEV